jgi:hypothetical protein
MCVILNKTVLDHPTIRFPFSVLNEALSAMTKSDCRSPGFEAGKRLFTYLFSQDEIDNGSLHALKRSSRRPMTMGFFTHPQLQVKSHALLGKKMFKLNCQDNSSKKLDQASSLNGT